MEEPAASCRRQLRIREVSVTANGRPVVDLPPTFQFSLIGSIKDMWQGRSASAVQRKPAPGLSSPSRSISQSI